MSVSASILAYAELDVATNFSFLEGASHPDEMVLQAAALGHRAVAVTDRNSLAGVVRAHVAAKNAGIRLVVGTRLVPRDGPDLLCFPSDRAAYGRLAALLTRGKRRTGKGDCELYLEDVLAHGAGQILVAVAPDRPDDGFEAALRKLKYRFKTRLYLSVSILYRGDDRKRLMGLRDVAARVGIPLVATNAVRAHVAARKPLLDVLTCIREHCAIHEAGLRLAANGERHLKAPAEMARLFRDCPEAVGRTMEIVEQCRFSLDELRYEYPVDPVPEGMTPQSRLAQLARDGAAERAFVGSPRGTTC